MCSLEIVQRRREKEELQREFEPATQTQHISLSTDTRGEVIKLNKILQIYLNSRFPLCVVFKSLGSSKMKRYFQRLGRFNGFNIQVVDKKNGNTNVKSIDRTLGHHIQPLRAVA